MTSAGAIPAGTFMPGTKVQVGSHRVIVERYLSEGGFAHVYVVRLPSPVAGTDLAVLKRVAVPDKAALANMRTEVETMKKLKGHRHIVTYYDSHASQLKGGGYEVFLLMEFCAGGGLIDFMNTRLQNRLTEPEILKIFTDVAEGVACMHYLKPALLHRDLKVENVLIAIDAVNQSFCYKLCDFGSAATPTPAATNTTEGRIIEDDVQRHTTMQYRSPEMIDVYRGHPIDEKSDIWALGVFLYKLCYYTTPFEEAGQMAILNASFKFPAYPPFSDRLKLLIAEMLQEDPRRRPNIYRVLKESCYMRGKECPVPDIYSSRSKSESRLTPQQLAATPSPVSSVGATPGANFSPPIQETQILPEITPMRRGRPAKSVPVTQPTAEAPKPSHSPFRYETKPATTTTAAAAATATAAIPKRSPDPFGALDRGVRRNVSEDELSMKYPTLEEFTLYHDKSSRFGYEGPQPAQQAQSQQAPPPQPQQPIQHHRGDSFVTKALADEVFARSSPSSATQTQQQSQPQTQPITQQPAQGRAVSATAPRYPVPAVAPPQSNLKPAPAPTTATSKSTSDLRREAVDLTKQTTTHIPSHTPTPPPVRAPAVHHEVPGRPSMVSTGTMTSPPSSPLEAKQPHADEHDLKKSRSPSRPRSRGQGQSQAPGPGQGLPKWPPSQERKSLSMENVNERVQLSSGELPPRPSTKHGDKEGSGATSGNGDSRRASREHHRPGFLHRLGSRSSKHHPSHHGNAAKMVDWEKEEATSPAISARASLDMSRPSLDSYGGGGGSPWSKQRPTSMFLSPRDQLNEDHPRASLDSSLSRPLRYEVESAHAAAAVEYSGGQRLHLTRSESGQMGNISSDVDYLRAREEDAKGKHHSHGHNVKSHKKKGSLSGLSFSGTKKGLISGRFGDAFRKFESSNGKSHHAQKDIESESEREYEVEERTPAAMATAKATAVKPALSTIHSPNIPPEEFPQQPQQFHRPLPQRHQTTQQQEPRERSIDLDSLDDDALEQLTDDSSLSPEVRREIERRRALLEEKRVAAAAAEYRRRLEQGQQAGAQDSNVANISKRFSGLPGGVANAQMIQNKVQSLLRNENSRPPPKKTASGYGKYIDVGGGDDGENRGNNGSDRSDDEAERTADTGVS
ncbi:hypothetical protein KEM56_001729, partial [Ascosphaera pollenicola]